jgi:DNA (cytosine-5)-methyltransferase 1
VYNVGEGGTGNDDDMAMLRMQDAPGELQGSPASKVHPVRSWTGLPESDGTVRQGDCEAMTIVDEAKVLTVGSLFAGIGGFDLGFERAGFKTVWQVEKNAYCRRVLRKNFPNASRKVTDVRFAGARNLLPVDVICGGFPCQDISNAGKREGIDGEQSGLWAHMFRIVSELRPKYVVVENVAALLGRGIGRVLGDLSSIGYDAEWEAISAADVGAPHLRERVWIAAYNSSVGLGKGWAGRSDPGRKGESQQSLQVAYANIFPVVRASIARKECDPWMPEPEVDRVVDGLSVRVVAAELRSLGNAVVPQIPELIAKRIREVLA